jgi:hypothetical protein
MGIALFLCIATHDAKAAHYGTVLAPTPSSAPTLRISDHPPLCSEPSVNCIETTGATHTYPVADGDHVTIEWTNQPQPIGGVIELGRLYLPLDSTANAYTPTPITLLMQMPADGPAQVVVEYAATSHHVPLPPHTWQSITVYNPNERVIYVRLDTPPIAPP